MNERIVQKNEWIHVFNTMKNFNRLDGYVNDVRGKLTYFDGYAIIDGVGSLFVTIEEVQSRIDNYKN